MTMSRICQSPAATQHEQPQEGQGHEGEGDRDALPGRGPQDHAERDRDPGQARLPRYFSDWRSVTTRFTLARNAGPLRVPLL